jgi:PHP family Zn ribbon phosphoesterase
MDYFEIMEIIKKKDKKRFLYTVEFFPEEGKYHYDGHRECKVLMSPAETKKGHGKCPVCGKGVTVGVMHRVDALADRPAGFAPKNAVPARHLVPLVEIIAEAFDCGVNTARVRKEYERLINEAGSEFAMLLDLSDDEIKKVCQPKVAEGIIKVRQGKLNITPGYDGEFGKINIFGEKQEIKPKGPRQVGLF